MVIILKNIPLIRKLDNFKDFFFQSLILFISISYEWTIEGKIIDL